jgi:hypothetical protein
MPPSALISSIAISVALLSDSSMIAVVPVSEKRTPTLISPSCAKASEAFFNQICGKPASENAPAAAPAFRKLRLFLFTLCLHQKQRPRTAPPWLADRVGASSPLDLLAASSPRGMRSG